MWEGIEDKICSDIPEKLEGQEPKSCVSARERKNGSLVEDKESLCTKVRQEILASMYRLILNI